MDPGNGSEFVNTVVRFISHIVQMDPSIDKKPYGINLSFISHIVQMDPEGDIVVIEPNMALYPTLFRWTVYRYFLNLVSF